MFKHIGKDVNTICIVFRNGCRYNTLVDQRGRSIHAFLSIHFEYSVSAVPGPGQIEVKFEDEEVPVLEPLFTGRVVKSKAPAPRC